MNLDRAVRQYGTLIIGLMIGGGFAFGGIASYAGMIGGSGNGDDGDRFNATLPADNYVEEPIMMTSREQYATAVSEEAVIVNGLYRNESGLEQLRDMETLPGEFDDRVYVSVASRDSNPPYLADYPVEEYPAVIIVGSSRSRPSVTVEGYNRSEVETGICEVLASWGSLAAKCRSR